MKTKAFQDWTIQQLENNFGLIAIKQKDNQILQNWLNVKAEINEIQKTQLIKIMENCVEGIWSWTEQELVIQVIALLLDLSDFVPQNLHLFSQRTLSCEIGEWKIQGNPDLMLASGRFEPIAPYVCFHEFKRQGHGKNDPHGQLLASMLVAQELNKNHKTIYGVYITGQNWFFCVLSGKEYSFSLAYDCTKPEIFDIFRILKGFKHILDTEILV